MEPKRLNFIKLTPEPVKVLYALGPYLAGCGLDRSLLELVATRVSQINGCAFCIDMHTQEARAAGETEQRLYALSVWRETPFFSPRERAALDWAEAVTLVAGGVPDAVYEEARRQFAEKELVDLTWAVVATNSWNRLNVSFRPVPGTYTPHLRAQVEAQLTGSPARR